VRGIQVLTNMDSGEDSYSAGHSHEVAGNLAIELLRGSIV
jgi:hypothetical protein